MNYLAHLFLAGKSPELQLGNLLGDFVKGNLENYTTFYSESIINGIKIHRKIDNFTDTHKIYIASKRRISASNKRFSGIIIDICYDHFLANHWSIFSDENLDNFIDSVYQTLEENQRILPMSLQQALPRMIAENWLGCYKNLEGVGLTFTRIARRLKRENSLTTALDELINNYAEVEADFLIFFPEIISYVETISQDLARLRY